jgi:hypothetical protein
MHIVHKGKANTNKVMHILSRQRNYLLNVAYHKLRARKHFGYYVIGLGGRDYEISSAEEILNQIFIIPKVHHGWETMGKESKLVARVDLRRSQCHGSTMANAMQSNLPDTVRDVVQANHRNGASGIDESHHVLRSHPKAL